ncbi:MAG: head-tail adaptor protein [Pseudomonadota bacterium]|nr:head-tail adaptor protein [Pseudomonadota bacterium]
MSLDSGRRDKRIAFKAKRAGVDGRGHSTVGEAWELLGKASAAIYFGSGEEQRAAAQDGGVQRASFEVLANSVTRALSVGNRLYYPIRDADPEKWPAWDIRAIAPIGSNEGFRITAETVAR